MRARSGTCLRLVNALVPPVPEGQRRRQDKWRIALGVQQAKAVLRAIEQEGDKVSEHMLRLF